MARNGVEARKVKISDPKVKGKLKITKGENLAYLPSSQSLTVQACLPIKEVFQASQSTIRT